MSDPWRINLPTSVLLKAVAPRLEVPPDGWHASNFAKHGRQLILAIDRLAKVTQRRAIPFVARKAMELFRGQLEQVIHRVVPSSRLAKSDPISIQITDNESLWMRALEEVFAQQGIRIITELVPPIQSVMGQAYSRVGILMGHATDENANQRIASQAREIAQKITRINQTTRDSFAAEIRAAISDGLTVTETAAKLRETMPTFERARINTIARTETNNAWQKGSIAAFQQSETLTHVSVIGCESREEDRWGQPSYQPFLYRGESTCNIQMVPITDSDKLNFHPNHTGTTVPAAFRNADGTVSQLE